MDFRFLGVVGKFDFYDLADAHAAYSGEAQMLEGFGSSGPLRIEDGWFWHDVNEDFHGAKGFVSDGFEQADFLVFKRVMRVNVVQMADRERQRIEKISPYRV